MYPSSTYPAGPNTRTVADPANVVGAPLVFTQVLCAVGSAILLWQPTNWFSTLDPTAVVWGTCLVLLGLMIAGIATVKATGQNPWLHPLSLITAYYWFRYGWGALVVFYWDRYPWQAIPYLRDRFVPFGMRANLENSCHILLLSGLALFLGLSLPVKGLSEMIPRARWRIDEAKFRTNLALYTPIGLVITVALQYALPLSVQNLVANFGWVVNALIIVASYWLFTTPPSTERSWLAVFLILSVGGAELAGFRTGMVQGFVYPVLAALYGYILAKRRPPYLVLALVLPLLLCVLLPWITLYKNVAPPSAMPVLERIEATNEQVSFRGAEFITEMTLDRFLARASGPPFASVFSQFYPTVYPFAEGRTFLLELESMVPRILWPDKPEVIPEINRYTAGVGMIREGDGTSAGFDAPTEYYVNFGLAGVLLFSLLHGIYLAVLYDWLVVRSHYLIGGSIFAVFMFLNLDFFGVVQLVTNHLHMLPIWLGVFYMLSVDRRRLA